jgi:hypothetical protein
VHERDKKHKYIAFEGETSLSRKICEKDDHACSKSASAEEDKNVKITISWLGNTSADK